MLRVTFDIVPGGNEGRSKTIGIMELANIETRMDGIVRRAVVMRKTPPFKGALRAAWRKGVVNSDNVAVNGVMAGEDAEFLTALATGHHRTRRGVYDLLFRAMRALGMEARQ